LFLIFLQLLHFYKADTIPISAPNHARSTQPSTLRGMVNLAQADRLGPKVGGRLALLLHSSYEPGELWQWQCHYDSTINSAVAITVTTKCT